MSPLTSLVRKTTDIQSYAVLRERVRAAIRRGKERAADAVEREKVRTCWEIGKLINEHVLRNRKPQYGRSVVLKLSRDLAISQTELNYMRECARAFPIHPPGGGLSWSHIRAGLGINDPTTRTALFKQAAEKNWSRDELRAEIRRLKLPRAVAAGTGTVVEWLVPNRGTVYTYRIRVRRDGVPRIDLGFSCYHDLSSAALEKYREGDLVEAVRKTDGVYTFRKTGRTEKDLFTYNAKLLEVTDADTLWMMIDLGFGLKTEQQLRLRGLDAPERATRDGQRAKRFVERELRRAGSILVTSSKSDKYDRYLADIFYTVAGEERFLNNRLLAAGLAVKI